MDDRERAHDVVTAPAGDRPRSFRGPREIVRTAARAAAAMPQGAAVALLSGAFLSAWFGWPYPVTTSLIALAAGTSLPAIRTGAAGIILGAGVVFVVVADPPDALDPLRWCSVVAIATIVGMGLNVRLAVPPASASAMVREDRAATFLAACQRHPWAFTAIIGLVALADAALCAGKRERFEAIFVPLVALAIPALLSARGRDLIGKLAPAAVGAPLAALGMYSAGRLATGFRLDTGVAVFGFVLIVWTLFLAHAVARRAGERPMHTTLAWIWVALALGLGPLTAVLLRVVGHVSIDMGPGMAAGLLVVSPFLFSAGATLATRPAVAVPAAWLATAASAALTIALIAVLGRDDARTWRSEEWFGTGFAGRRTLGQVEFILRHAELGALCMGIGALVGRGRSMTALPADHPVFTEGPYVARKPLVTQALVQSPAADADRRAAV